MIKVWGKFRSRLRRHWLSVGKAHVASWPMQNRSFARRLTLLAAGGMVVSSVALAVGSLGASALFGRGRPETVLFAAGTVAVVAIAYGCLVSSAMARRPTTEHLAPRGRTNYPSTLADVSGSGPSDAGTQR